MGNDGSGNIGCFQHGCKCWKRIYVVRVCARSFLIVYIFFMKYKSATSVENEDGGGNVEVEEREEGIKELFKEKEEVNGQMGYGMIAWQH